MQIRNTNPIEPTSATGNLRSRRSRNYGSRDTTLTVIFKQFQTAQRRWRRLKLFQTLKLVVNIKFEEGEQVTVQSDRNAA